MRTATDWLADSLDYLALEKLSVHCLQQRLVQLCPPIANSDMSRVAYEGAGRQKQLTSGAAFAA